MPNPISILCFEDEGVHQLAPAVTARPAYAISCASLRLIDWLRQLGPPIWGDCRPHLRTIQQLDYALPPATPPTAHSATAHSASPLASGPILFVNARLVPTPALGQRLQQILQAGQPTVVRDHSGAVAVAWLNEPHGFGPLAQAAAAARQAASVAAEPISAYYAPQQPPPPPVPWRSPWAELLAYHASVLPPAAEIAPLPSFVWPHDIVAHHMQGMDAAMQWRIANGSYTQLQDGVFVADGVNIGPYPVIDTSHGPIILEKNVQIGPFCYLSGPVHVAAAARVLEHAALKDGVALGHTTKVGGEVEASVIESYSNKQHHGFLGHSYLGSWINLGAGTCNSDLKNTYGTINLDYGHRKVATGMQFMGCVMGDYSKTAINTGIFTGKMIGVCSMLYGFVTSNVPSFVNYARLFGQTATLPPEVMVSTQARMFARRKVQQRDCDRQLIIDMFQLTEEERHRQMASAQD